MIVRFSAKLFTAAVLFTVTAACAATTDAPAKLDAEKDWLSTTTLSDRGGHILGNPDATKSVIEFVSYTCGHCATFELEGASLLKEEFIKNGSANLEMRNMPLNAIDLTVAALARCGAQDSFFSRHNYWLKTQKEWVKAANDITAETSMAAKNGNDQAMMLGIYIDMGLSEYAAKSGVTDAAAKSCLTDEKNADIIKAMGTEAKSELGITGTPSFVVNGFTARGVHNYEALKPLLLK